MKKIEKWIVLEKWEKTVAERPEERRVSWSRVYLSPLPLYFIPKQQFHSQATFFTLKLPGSVLDLIKIQLLAIQPIPTNYFKGIPRSTKCHLAY